MENPWKRRPVLVSQPVAGPSSAQQKASIPLAGPMQRPGFGKAGRKVLVEANFLPLRFPKTTRPYQYEISIIRNKELHGAICSENLSITGPAVFNRNVLNTLLRFKGKSFPCPLAYNGRSIVYTPESIDHVTGTEAMKIRVNKDGLELTAQDESEKNLELLISFEFTNRIDFQELLLGKLGNVNGRAQVHALDVILSCAPLENEAFAHVGNSFFNSLQAKPMKRKQSTTSIWRGFYQSARACQGGLMLNVDSTSTLFWDGGNRPLLSLIQDFYPPLQSRGWKHIREYNRCILQLSIHFKGIRIRASHNNYSYKLEGFSQKAAIDQVFEFEGRMVSVAEYFSEYHNIRLKDMHAPCVRVHPKKEVYVPLELLSVEPKQRFKGELSKEQQGMIAYQSCIEPRIQRSQTLANIATIGYKSNDACKRFGLSIGNDLAKVTSRQLKPPLMSYRNGLSEPRNGEWHPSSRDRIRLTAKIPAVIHSWAFLNLTSMTEAEIIEFRNRLLKEFQDTGITGVNPNPEIRHCHQDEVGNEMRALNRRHTRPAAGGIASSHLSLLMIIKERPDKYAYNTIKRVGDLEHGIVTQVCLRKNCTTGSRSGGKFINNLVMKINGKLGGVTSVPLPYREYRTPPVPDPDFTKYPHIVLGADVTHPSSGYEGPSVAALVGSRDCTTSQFCASLRKQARNREEIMLNIGDMFKEVYRTWYLSLGSKYHAQAIIMFRDGVSETQFQTVMETEVDAIRRTCLSINKSFKPKITYIIINKRHHARFFPTDEENCNRSGNILAGTVIDSTVTSPDSYEFYLNSHAGVYGTNRPSKYTVLIDENETSPDMLQGYVFRLCHGYARCGRSVSMVNSAYYAHLLSFRARSYLEEIEPEESKSAGRGGRGARGATNAVEWTSSYLHNNHRGNLFFI